MFHERIFMNHLEYVETNARAICRQFDLFTHLTSPHHFPSMISKEYQYDPRNTVAGLAGPRSGMLGQYDEWLQMPAQQFKSLQHCDHGQPMGNQSANNRIMLDIFEHATCTNLCKPIGMETDLMKIA